MTKEIAIPTPNEFAIFDPKLAKSLPQLIAENMGDEELSALDLERITVPSNGITTWMYNQAGKEVEVKELYGVIAHVQKSRGYWPQAEGGGDLMGVPPQCGSEDGVIGMGDPGGECAKCPLNEFGTDPKGGKGKACKETRNLFFLTPEGRLPYIVVVPPTSLKAFKKFCRDLVQAAKSIKGVIVKLTLEKAKSATGFTYGVINFEIAGDLSEEQAGTVRAISTSFTQAGKEGAPSFDQ